MGLCKYANLFQFVNEREEELKIDSQKSDKIRQENIEKAKKYYEDL